MLLGMLYSTFAARFDLPSPPPSVCHVKVQKRDFAIAHGRTCSDAGRGSCDSKLLNQTKVKVRIDSGANELE